jgi:hypothetical protein
MSRLIAAAAVAFFLCGTSFAQANQAYEGYGNCGCGNWGMNWWGGVSYGLVHREEIPFYALYPPVYYSQPVPRTYGYSPFAYPGWVMTPEVVDEKPTTIINPHVPQPDAEEKPTALRVTSNVQVIANPYVVNNAAVASIDAK